MPLPIEDYAVIGDLHTAAMVGKDGSIDWLCLPRFDSEACFARLLGTDDHGYWKIAPKGPEGTVTAVRRCYRPGTLVLETEMDTAEGTIRITDCMPVREGNPQVVRLVEGVAGKVTVRMQLALRFGYGEAIPWVTRDDHMLTATAGPDAVALWTRAETHGEGFTTVSEATLGEGEQMAYILAWYASHTAPPPPIDPFYCIGVTDTWWQTWSAACTYRGDYSEAVLRSLITLKALTYEPTGGIVAAATTSRPETLGGKRNWDYRYCWLRDATLTLEALLRGGYHAEAMAWRDWLLRATAGDVSKLQIMYGPSGERRLDEWEADWLPGYENAAPVRIGNAAAGQYQLDVYGEVMSALYSAGHMDGLHSRAIWDLQTKLIEFLETGWKEPDDGIWEVRGPRRHFTHSKIMAWVAVDRAVRTMEDWPGLPGPVDKWRSLRDEIHTEIVEKGWNPDKQAFTQYYGSDQLDASVLMMPLVGFLPAKDPRVVSTVAAIQRELVADGYVLRYRTQDDGAVDGLTGREGAFLACSFWLVDCLHMVGRTEEAREMFERLLSLRNDVGLLAEEYDPVAKRLVGNFPQAFSHVSLVNSASRMTGQEPLSPGQAQVAKRLQRLLSQSLGGPIGSGAHPGIGSWRVAGHRGVGRTRSWVPQVRERRGGVGGPAEPTEPVGTAEGEVAGHGAGSVETAAHPDGPRARRAWRRGSTGRETDT